jgi:CDP-diacylglycerol--serine O-phosphatidyltransferase
VTIKKHIPNFITCLNLLSGCAGIYSAFNGNLETAAYLIGLAALFDFLDGTAARLLHVKSEIGRELDSLSDVISFGMLPGAILFQLMQNSRVLPVFEVSGLNLFPFLAFAVPVFSALRLAKFNIDTRQTDSFLGLPTPANAMLLGSLPLIAQQSANHEWLGFAAQLLGNFYFLALLCVATCWLLVSEVPLMSLKLKTLKWNDNRKQFAMLGITLALVLLLGYAAIPLILAAYITVSLA